MRELRQDEIDLINRIRRRKPLTTAIKDLIVETERTTMALTADDWRRGNKGFSKGDPVYREPSQTLTVPVEDLPQEETLEQIKRMIEHLPEDDKCEKLSFTTHCPIKAKLMISKWAREFLKQMIRKEERP